MLMRVCRLLGIIHGNATILLKIVYALDIKFWVRWCTCGMWRMLLPCGKLIGLLLFCPLFLISILFLKPNICTLNTFKD